MLGGEPRGRGAPSRPSPSRLGEMAAHKPVEWVQAVVNRFDEQVSGRPGGLQIGGGGGPSWGDGKGADEGVASFFVPRGEEEEEEEE